MIKAAILDVDGVIVGKKPGTNFPNPHPNVIQRLKEITQSGLPIILASAKFNYAIKGIILSAHLDNPHCTDGGALIINPIKHQIITKHVIDPNLIKQIIAVCEQNDILLELYGIDDYYVETKADSKIMENRVKILQKEPTYVMSFNDLPEDTEIIKMITVATNRTDRDRITDLLTPFTTKLNLLWNMHPASAPIEYGIMTVFGISKQSAAREVASALTIPLENILGVGDTIGDWEFMQICGYAAAMGNADVALKSLVSTKGDKGFIGPSVDDDGILTIFDHFLKGT